MPVSQPAILLLRMVLSLETIPMILPGFTRSIGKAKWNILQTYPEVKEFCINIFFQQYHTIHQERSTKGNNRRYCWNVYIKKGCAVLNKTPACALLINDLYYSLYESKI